MSTESVGAGKGSKRRGDPGDRSSFLRGRDKSCRRALPAGIACGQGEQEGSRRGAEGPYFRGLVICFRCIF